MQRVDNTFIDKNVELKIKDRLLMAESELSQVPPNRPLTIRQDEINF